jgi:hypothetical protein
MQSLTIHKLLVFNSPPELFPESYGIQIYTELTAPDKLSELSSAMPDADAL